MNDEERAQLQRIEDKLDTLIAWLFEALGEDFEDDEDQPGTTLDGEPNGRAREPGQPL